MSVRRLSIAISSAPMSPMAAGIPAVPALSWKGLTDDTISSSTLLLFSSMTPCMTMVPYMNTNMYMSRPKM